MADVKADLAYVMELPDADKFIIEPSEIAPIGKETFEAIKVFAKYAAQVNNVASATY